MESIEATEVEKGQVEEVELAMIGGKILSWLDTIAKSSKYDKFKVGTNESYKSNQRNSYADQKQFFN
jgi:hypothetical protein